MKRILSFTLLTVCALTSLAPKAGAVSLLVQRVPTNQVQLTWQSVSNNSEQLQHSTNLINWQIVMRPYPAPFNNTIFTNVLPTLLTNDFFRLQLSILTNTPVPTTPGMYLSNKLVSGGLTRTYRLFIPPSYNPSNLVYAPLAVILHGGGQSADTFAALHPDLFSNANTNGMIVVLPDATPRDDTVSWMVTDPRPYEAFVNDTQFILDLVNVLKCALFIDNLRVYAGGFSNGGQMVHKLGIETTNVFAALASVASTIAGSQGTNPIVLPGPSLERYPILIVNATNDCVRPYYGGVNIEGANQSPAQAAANYWVTNNGCTTNTVSYFVTNLVTNYNRIFRFQTECYPPTVTNQNSLVTNSAVLARVASCGTNRAVNFVTLTDGGHNWPDADDNVGFDANASVIAFFLQNARTNVVAPALTLLPQFSVTSPIPNGGTFQAQLTLQNPGTAIIPCGYLEWFNPNLNVLRFLSWNTPSGSTVGTNNDGDLTWSFDRVPGNSSLTLNVNGVVNVNFGAGQEFIDVSSLVRILVGGMDGAGIDTNITIRVLSKMDFGDAPGTYPTLYADNGARHATNALRLGASVDVEFDGFPSINADGDDNNNTDDENGVVFLNAPQAGQTIGIAIFSSGVGKVDAWADYNRDGTWTNGNEQILSSLPVVAGSNYVSVLVDPFAATGVAGKTYWRFRLSSAGGLAPTGFAPNGEVEDYGTTMLPGSSTGNTNVGKGNVDWGDAPAAYPVLAANFGASHNINDGLCLGPSVDAETNGIPDPNALGDTADNGVNFGPLVRSTNAMVFSSAQVNVQGQGYLNAWIDFNGDGDWNDAGEQIVTSRFITFGGNPNLISFHVPGNAALGATFARFRFGVDAALPPSGPANDGEVEDYKVTITP